jgi:hypothetical protein
MFLVATIEELAFRVALSMAIYMFFPSDKFMVRMFASFLLSSIAFAVWHLFAYEADTGMMIIAGIAGVMFFIGYQLGRWTGGGETSFIGIVAGHWLWNISSSPNALLIVGGFLVIMTLLIFLTNKHAMSLLVKNINKMLGRR